MDRPQLDLVFLREDEDTDDNRAIVEIAEERSRSPRADDKDLDHLIEAVGLDPADFMNS